MPDDFQRKLTAILSADAVGYSRLMGDDDAATVRTLRAYIEVISDLVKHHRGRVVDSPGDNILSEFASVVDAVQCALEVQTVLGDRNRGVPEDRRMHFRIGVNLGDVIVEGDKLYGDGVNIAARLEALAEPGGICISGTVFEHIRNKLTLRDEYLGEHSVKNIADAVKVYRLLLEPREGEAPEGTGEAPEQTREAPQQDGGAPEQAADPPAPQPLAMGSGLPSRTLLVSALLATMVMAYGGWRLFGPDGTGAPVRATAFENAPPSIAVLAFNNMSDDPEQEYFSDGISEDLITDLAKISGLQVTSRNTTFAYKGQAVNISEVGRELGVAYVVEGSVRQANGRVRITAQLIDVATGAHVWADRFDRAMEDIFTVQDEVVGEIVAALRVTLTGDEAALIASQATDDLAAYDQVKRAWWYYQRYNPEDNQRARALFQQALEADPDYAEAMTGLGYTYYEEWAQFWVLEIQGLEVAADLARASLEIDPSDPGTYTLLSHAYLWTRQHDRALQALETGLALDPDDPWSLRDMAELLLFAGRLEESVDYARRAMEKQPQYVASFPFTLGFAYNLLGRHDEAIAVLEEALDLNPLYTPAYLLLTGSHIALGHQAEAEGYAAQAMSMNPQLSVDLMATRMPFRDPSLWETWSDLLRSAGIP